MTIIYGRSCPLNLSKKLAYAAMLAAAYAGLAQLQNLLLPGSASLMLQFRLAEALCVLSFFTPAAPLGLAVGCLLFNLTSGAALPLDFLVGTAATYLSCKLMWLTRRLRVGRLPLPGLLLPALFNGVLVGWELAHYLGGGFWVSALYVALGEAIVLLVPGWGLYAALSKGRLGGTRV